MSTIMLIGARKNALGLFAHILAKVSGARTKCTKPLLHLCSGSLTYLPQHLDSHAGHTLLPLKSMTGVVISGATKMFEK